MAYLLKGFLYLGVIYLLVNGLIAIFSLLNPVHIRNKKYLGYVVSGVVGAVVGVFAYIYQSLVLVLLGLLFPFVIVKLFGGEPNLDPKQIDPKTKNFESLVEEGVDLAEEGNYPEALTVLNNALQIDPEDTVALTNKANILNRLGEFKSAIAVCDKVIASHPENVWAILYKATALANSSEALEAVKCCDLVLKLDPQNEEAARLRTRCWRKANM